MSENYDTVTITNVIPSGAAFGVKHGTGQSCYIPATVMFTTGCGAGDVIDVLLVENPNALVRERTPYMVRYIAPRPYVQMDLALPEPEQPRPVLDTAAIYEFVRSTMREAGGVWTIRDLFHEYMGDDAVREDHLEEYVTVGNAVRSMFTAGQCSKWSMWRSSSQTKPSKDWYSCYPEKVTVDEFEE